MLRNVKPTLIKLNDNMILEFDADAAIVVFDIKDMKALKGAENYTHILYCKTIIYSTENCPDTDGNMCTKDPMGSITNLDMLYYNPEYQFPGFPSKISTTKNPDEPFFSYWSKKNQKNKLIKPIEIDNV